MANLTVLSLDDPIDASLAAINGNFSALNDELGGKAAVSHAHDGSAITGGVIAPARLGGGSPTPSTFLRGDSLWQAVQWSDVSGKPTSFPPEAHAHDASEIVSGTLAVARLGSGVPAAWKFLRGDGLWVEVDWSQLTGKPSSFTPAAHTHAPSELTQAGATLGQALVWNGSQWAPGTVATGGSPTPYTAQGASFTAASNTRYRLTANSLTVTLPASPSDGDWVELIGSVTGTTVARNGKTIMGLAENMTLDANPFALRLVYISSDNDWRIAP